MQGVIGTGRFRIVAAGIAGSGKNTVGTALARRLGAVYVDGDSVHSVENVAKMAAGSWPTTSTTLNGAGPMTSSGQPSTVTTPHIPAA